MEGFGYELRRIRQLQQLSTRDLEEVVGVRHDIITRVENGKVIPTDEDAKLLADWMTFSDVDSGRHRLRRVRLQE